MKILLYVIASTILEAIGDAVYAMDRDERILFANRRALQLWGKSADVVGQSVVPAQQAHTVEHAGHDVGREPGHQFVPALA